MGATDGKLTSRQVRADFNEFRAVLHYTRAAHGLGLWASEHAMINRALPDTSASLLELGCGAGRVTLGLWQMGFRSITAIDFAEALLEQAQSLAIERRAGAIRFLQVDATRLAQSEARMGSPYAGALFMFNGLMQIPGRENRRSALAGILSLCSPGAPLLFTTHDRDASPLERRRWQDERRLWESGGQDPRLLEFGDRYFEDEAGRTFMHLPDREEILGDLAATGWAHEFDAMRAQVAAESRAVKEFSDDCRFWLARRPLVGTQSRIQ